MIKKKNQKPDDLIDVACEPSVYYFSSFISQLYLSSIIELSIDQESRSLTSIYEQVENCLDQLELRLAACWRSRLHSSTFLILYIDIMQYVTHIHSCTLLLTASRYICLHNNDLSYILYTPTENCPTHEAISNRYRFNSNHVNIEAYRYL